MNSSNLINDVLVFRCECGEDLIISDVVSEFSGFVIFKLSSCKKCGKKSFDAGFEKGSKVTVGKLVEAVDRRSTDFLNVVKDSLNDIV